MEMLLIKSLLLLLIFRREVDDENRRKTICLQNATHKSFHKVTHVLLFRDERNL